MGVSLPTWESEGWKLLYRVRVSTCSGTSPWVLSTCRHMRSRAGPRWWCTSLLASGWNVFGKKFKSLHNILNVSSML